jgi:hypothetical protein
MKAVYGEDRTFCVRCPESSLRTPKYVEHVAFSGLHKGYETGKVLSCSVFVFLEEDCDCANTV